MTKAKKCVLCRKKTRYFEEFTYKSGKKKGKKFAACNLCIGLVQFGVI